MEKIKSNCKYAIEKNKGATDFTVKYIEEYDREQYERN